MDVRRREEKKKEFSLQNINVVMGVNDLLSNSECLLQILPTKME